MDDDTSNHDPGDEDRRDAPAYISPDLKIAIMILRRLRKAERYADDDIAVVKLSPSHPFPRCTCPVSGHYDWCIAR